MTVKASGLNILPSVASSDRIGRKIPLIVGLMIFSAGLFLGFLTDSIYFLILARALQGGGAVAAVIFSWIGDDIPEEKRNRAMAVPRI